MPSKRIARTRAIDQENARRALKATLKHAAAMKKKGLAARAHRRA